MIRTVGVICALIVVAVYLASSPPWLIAALQRARRPCFFGALGLFTFGVVNIVLFRTGEPHFRLGTPTGTVVAIMFMLAMPLVAAFAGVPILHRRIRITVAALLWIVGVLLVGLEGVLSLGFFMVAAEDPPTLISTGRYTLAADQFLGIGSEGGGNVDQVCRLLPGLMLARSVYDRGSGPDIVVHVETADRVRIDDSLVVLRSFGWPICR